MATFDFPRFAYRRSATGKYTSLYGDKLAKVHDYDDYETDLFESDLQPELRVLLDAYEDSDEPSTGHCILTFDIEVDITGGYPNINEGDKAITAIALHDSITDKYIAYILDPEKKIADGNQDGTTILSFRTEEELLSHFLNKWKEINPTIVTGWNCIPINQSVWMRDKIVKIKNITPDSHLFDSKLITKFPIVNKEKWNMKLSNGQRICSSGDHKFPIIMVTPSEYITFNATSKSNWIPYDLKMRQIKSFLKNNDIYCAVQMRENNNVKNENYSNEELYLAGLVYTDGSLKDKHNPRHGYSFYQSDFPFMQKLDNFGLAGKISGPHKDCYSRYISPKLIPNAHELIYYNEDTKKLNLELLSTLSYVQFMYFLSGLLDGDGYISCGRIEWCNYNNDIEILNELCNWNGIFCTLSAHRLRFIDINKNDLKVLKSSRWDVGKLKESNIARNSKQKSSQIRFKRIGNVYYVKVMDVTYDGTSAKMMDIETDTHYFVSKGIKTHNCNFFDVPYLYNRIRVVLGKKAAYSLSPIGVAYQNKFTKKMVIAGISCLDYLELYKKFLGVMKTSYALGNVAKDEDLKTQKLTYKGSLTDLYRDDLSRYIEYNLADVRVVVELDQKYDFIYLARSVCHKGHIPYEWFAMSSRFIDGAILMYLHRNNMIASNKPIGGREEYAEMEKEGEDGFVGAYVKEPVPGIYDWICSADITSLYPSVIMTLNISPETKVGKISNWDYTEYHQGLVPAYRVGETIYQKKEIDDLLKDNKISVSSNGVMYRQSKLGVIPTILDLWFNERVEFRNLAHQYKKDGDIAKAAFYNRRQLRQKIFLNSVYGTLGLPIFRFYDRDNAEATTISGQTIIRSAEKLVNRIYRDKFVAAGKDPGNEDFVKYIDTDSVTGDSQLLLYDGIKKQIKDVFFDVKCIKELIDITGRHFKFPCKLQLPYYDEQSKLIKYGDVQYIEKHKVKKKLFKIKTTSGKHVTVTEDHSLMVMENDVLIQKTPLELKKGDKVISI